MSIFVQIGTNNGNDEFNNIVKSNKPHFVILVEPNRELNSQIEQNYSYMKGRIAIENVAINTKSGPCEVVIPKGRENMFSDLHYSLIPMDDWGTDFYSVKTNGITFNELCEKYSISEIDFLQIDTEGFDSQIILSIDFNKVKIKKLRYENWGFNPEECYTRYGEDGKKYGCVGMKEVEQKLTSLGYKLSKVFSNNSTDIEAVLS